MKATKPLFTLLAAIIWLLVATSAASTSPSVAFSASEALQNLPTATFAAADTTMSGFIARAEQEAALEAALEVQRLKFERPLERRLSGRASGGEWPTFDDKKKADLKALIAEAVKEATADAVNFFQYLAVVFGVAGLVSLGITIWNCFSPAKTRCDECRPCPCKKGKGPKKMGTRAKRRANRSSETQVEEGR